MRQFGREFNRWRRSKPEKGWRERQFLHLLLGGVGQFHTAMTDIDIPESGERIYVSLAV